MTPEEVAAVEVEGVKVGPDDWWYCYECKCVCIRGFSIWRRVPKTVLAEFKKLGWKRSDGRGLCTTCYLRNKKKGTLDNYPIEGEPWADTRCTRCGIKGKMQNKVCVDCRDVTVHLNEFATWKEVA